MVNQASAVADGNDHLAPERLSTLLVDEIAAIEASIDDRVNLQWLGKQKIGIDTTTKILVRGTRGVAAAVIVCSRPAAPELIARSTAMAEQIRTLVGERLGRVIPRPIAQGYVDGCSYVILPCYREFSSWKPMRVYQRLRMRPAVFRWLAQASREAADTLEVQNDAAATFGSQLAYLTDLPFIDNDLRAVIELQQQRLDDGTWIPRHTFDHNDLWLGNIMLPNRSERSANRGFPFILIDWGGANPVGFGMYDMVRAARAFKLSDTAFASQIHAHSRSLGCEVQDTRGHLLASLARLHQHLEHFPEERYIATFKACWTRLVRALRTMNTVRE